MDWFRHYHGLCTDPKLHRVAKAAKVSRGLVIAAWCAILETASQNDPRGTAEDIDDASLAFMIDIKPGVAGRILQAIRAAGLIDDEGTVAAWSKLEGSEVLTRYEWAVVRADLLKGDCACAYCGAASVPFDIDHVIPRSRGGGDEPGNLVVACQPCNRSKGARTPEEWLA